MTVRTKFITTQAYDVSLYSKDVTLKNTIPGAISSAFVTTLKGEYAELDDFSIKFTPFNPII
jgi:hypothetical protein